MTENIFDANLYITALLFIFAQHKTLFAYETLAYIDTHILTY